MLSVMYAEHYKLAPYAECHFAECHNDEQGILKVEVSLYH
jgi:hypothetical protein